MTEKTTWEAIKDLIASTEGDVEKFFVKGNSSAGTRVRKSMQDLKSLAQTLRGEVQDKKNVDKA